MEGNSNWKPNEQGRESLANNANDWRSTHEPDLRKRVIIEIAKKLKICFPNHIQNDINNAAFKFEDKIYSMATDKGDYLRKISEKIMAFDKKFRNVQSGSSVNGPNTSQDPVQALNLGQSPPNSLPYTQTPTNQQWFHQNNILESSVPIAVSGDQSRNIQMGEGVQSNVLTGYQRQTQGRQHFCSQSQHQTQSSSDMFQRQMDQQLLKEKIYHILPPYMQQKQSLLKQPIHQQMTHHTSLSTALSSPTSSGQQNSQYIPRHQFQTQRVHSAHQQQMYVPSQEQNQLMNGQDTQQNHLTSQQNNWEQQGAFKAPSSQKNNIASFQEQSQQNNNLQDMHQKQGFYSHNNNASALPSQQQQQYMHGGQSGNFNMYESSLFGTQGQEVGQSQPMIPQQYHQHPHNRFLQQHLNDTQRFQAAASQDSKGKTANANGGGWQEETYQKIKALKEKYLPILSTLLQKVSEKLQEVDSLPQQNMQHESIQKLRAGKSTLEQVIVFLNVERSSISESHRDRFGLYEEQVLRFTKNHQTVTRSPMQHRQSQSGYNQVHMLQSLDNDQMNISPAQSSMFHQKHFHHLHMQQQPQTNQQQSPGFVAPYITSQTDSYKQFSRFESEADSTASCSSKVHKIEPGCALMQEIEDINGDLVETVVNISNEDVYPSEVTSGTVVTCSYAPLVLSETLKARYKSGHFPQIQPLRLLVPVNYPYSPILFLGKDSSDTSLHKYDDLSARARSRFSFSMKEFSEPMSLTEIAQVWDVCARETMDEYTDGHGGGTFSSKYVH